jgi:hypothetical protein
MKLWISSITKRKEVDEKEYGFLLYLESYNSFYSM